MPSHPVPAHPGHIPRDRIPRGLGLSASEAARTLRISRRMPHAILAGTADTLRDIPTLSLPDALRAEIGCHGPAH